uniref:AHH domain-containing protein n=1 Tax=Dickeya zeae TaxID=204042 RepID=UPI00359C66F6
MDPLGLSNSSILDRAMGGQVGDKLSAHHVIPVEVWKENGAFLDKIGMGGQMNSAFNGIHVPGSETAMKADVGKGMDVFHSSNHNNYSNAVRDELSYIKDQHGMGELNDKEARDAVRKLQIDMKNKIWRGDVSKTKCGRMN